MNISSLFAYEHIVNLMVTTFCSQTNVANHSFIGKSLAFLPQRYFVKYCFVKNYPVIHHLNVATEIPSNNDRGEKRKQLWDANDVYLGGKRSLASLCCLHLNVIHFKIRWTASDQFNHILLVTLKLNKEKRIHLQGTNTCMTSYSSLQTM